MENKEFNLSEKITANMVESSWCSDGTPTGFDNIPSIYVKDVKEFIKRLKEELDKENECNPIINEIIDKLAGDKLNGK